MGVTLLAISLLLERDAQRGASSILNPTSFQDVKPSLLKLIPLDWGIFFTYLTIINDLIIKLFNSLFPSWFKDIQFFKFFC